MNKNDFSEFFSHHAKLTENIFVIEVFRRFKKKLYYVENSSTKLLEISLIHLKNVLYFLITSRIFFSET